MASREVGLRNRKPNEFSTGFVRARKPSGRSVHKVIAKRTYFQGANQLRTEGELAHSVTILGQTALKFEPQTSQFKFAVETYFWGFAGTPVRSFG